MAPENLEFHVQATRELEKATRWYANRSLSAADGFIASVNRQIAKIVADPNRFAAYKYGTRAARVRRYPYLIVFQALADRVRIVAVAHTSRRPGYWRNRRFNT